MPMPSVGSLVQMHGHANLTLLDKFSEIDNKLYYGATQLCYYNSIVPLQDHRNDLTIHVTQADKNLWNSILQTAKDYAKSLFDSLNSFEIQRVTQLPTGDDINPHCIYFLRVGGSVNQNVHDEYMYINGNWEVIGTTAIDYDALLGPYMTIASFEETIADYYTKTEIDDILADYYNKTEIDTLLQTLGASVEGIHSHDNLTVLDKLSEENGELTYDGEILKERYTEGDIADIIIKLWPTLFVSDFASKDNKIIVTADGKIFNPKGVTSGE